MPLQPEIPMDSPLRTHPKRGISPPLASTYPHGHISGHPRRGESLQAFEARKAIILRTMDAEQIEKAYQQTTQKINAILDEDRKKNEEIDREVGKLTQQREMEKKIFWKFREEKAKKDGKIEIAEVAEVAEAAEVKEEAEP